MSAFVRASRASILLLGAFSVAILASGCSSLPSWTDPDNWGSSSADEPTTATDTGSPQQPGAEGKTVAEASDQYPVLADTPSKAPPASSSDEQKQVAAGLVADRTQAQYSAEALQAGNEPPAAPPPPPSADASTVLPLPAATPAASSGAPAAAGQTASAETPSAPVPGTLPTPDGGAATATSAPPQLPAAPSVAPPPTSAQMSPPASQTAVAPDDAALGFQPSHAPPLDPAVAQLMGNRTAPAPGRHLASLSPAPPAAAPVSYGAVAATVMFPANSIALDANGLAQVQAAVAAYRANGGNGYIRVVGHSSSGAPTLSTNKQMLQSFERSQACANAVARALIREGVPAKRVLVEAASTLAPDEQRRAEIFLSS